MSAILKTCVKIEKLQRGLAAKQRAVEEDKPGAEAALERQELEIAELTEGLPDADRYPMVGVSRHIARWMVDRRDCDRELQEIADALLVEAEASKGQAWKWGAKKPEEKPPSDAALLLQKRRGQIEARAAELDKEIERAMGFVKEHDMFDERRAQLDAWAAGGYEGIPQVILDQEHELYEDMRVDGGFQVIKLTGLKRIPDFKEDREPEEETYLPGGPWDELPPLEAPDLPAMPAPAVKAPSKRSAAFMALLERKKESLKARQAMTA